MHKFIHDLVYLKSAFLSFYHVRIKFDLTVLFYVNVKVISRIGNIDMSLAVYSQLNGVIVNHS